MRIFILALVALLVAAPALADRDPRNITCSRVEPLATTDDDNPVYLAPNGGALVTRVGCSTLEDVATPATIQFQIATTDVTHATLTCAEAGAALTWVPATAANSIVEGQLLSYDVDAGTTSDYIVCAEVETRP